MGHFRGTLQGNRGEASRLGTKSTGLHARIASWEGAVSVELRYDEATGHDYAAVSLVPHQGAGIYRVLYEGRVDGSK